MARTVKQRPSNRPPNTNTDSIASVAARSAARSAPARPRNGKANSNLLHFESLPHYLKDNEFITKYYRANYNVKESVKSLFRVHNETGNIWTHLLGFVLFAALTFLTYYAKPEPFAVATETLMEIESRLYAYGKSNLNELMELESRLIEMGRSNLRELFELESRLLQSGKSNLLDLEDRAVKAIAHILDIEWPSKRWPIYIFTAGTMICLLTSTVCHLLGCCAEHIAPIVWRFDYAGIAVLIVSSFYPSVIYGFQCYRGYRNAHLVVITLLGLMTVFVTLMPAFQSPKLRHYRAGLFAGLGLWGIVPVLHGWYLNGDFSEVRHALTLDALMGLVYLLGAFIYSLRVPERWWPGAFDLFLHSHQLFHVCVIMGALVHYRAVNVLLAWRDRSGGCAVALQNGWNMPALLFAW